MFALSGILRPSQICLQLFGEKPFPAFDVMVSLESKRASEGERQGGRHETSSFDFWEDWETYKCNCLWWCSTQIATAFA